MSHATGALYPEISDLSYTPADREYFTIRPVERYRSAPFLIRQTAAYPIVGPRLGAVYFRNSLLALYPPPAEREMDVRFLVGLLNSRPAPGHLPGHGGGQPSEGVPASQAPRLEGPADTEVARGRTGPSRP